MSRWISYPPDRPRHHLVISQLRFFIAAGNQNLRARMIKRHQQSPIPETDLSRVFPQIHFMILNGFQRLKRDHPQRYNQ